MPAQYDFKAVPGYFVQTDPKTDDAEYDYAASENNFGLGPSLDWEAFTQKLHELNANADSKTHYKLIYAGRHGQGEHNVAESKYGTQAWDDYWSKLDGDGKLNWSDAHLTPEGSMQASLAGLTFSSQFKQRRMPVPQTYWTSPLYRCLQTANATFPTAHFVVKEMLREVMGEHTCDRRSAKTVLERDFAAPRWGFEEGFKEEDVLWRAEHRETWDEHDVRTRTLLTELFTLEGVGEVVSFTAHSGAIASLLRVTGHRSFKLGTGAVIPVLVQATRIDWA